MLRKHHFKTKNAKGEINMDIVIEKLNEIRQRPGMYLGKKSLILLAAYINGYVCRECELNNNFESRFSDFNEYVKRRFNIESGQDWLKIILFNSSTEEDAVDLFYKLLDEFFIEKAKSIDSQIRETMYTFGSSITKQECRTVKVRHFTDHGDPERFSVPHDHDVVWYPDNTFSYNPPTNYYDDVPEF